MKIIKRVFCKKNIKWFALLLILVIVIVFFSLRRNVDEVKIEDHDLYQYLTGIKIEYTGSIKMNKNTDDITKINFKKETVDLDSTPIYYKDEVKAIFPKNMIALYPLEGKLYKMNYFSTIYRDIDDIYVKDGSLKKKMNNSIIYDGKDLYFLATDATVKFGDQSYDLSAMSYVIVDTLNSLVQIYNQEKDEFFSFEDVKDQVIIGNGKISVNATLDFMNYNGKSRLILKDISKLGNLK